MLNFDMFLHSFETMIINTLSTRNLHELVKNKKPLITNEEILKKVLFRFYDPNLFEQDLAKCIDKATNNYCMEFVKC